MEELCHCGQPLHYLRPETRAIVEALILAVGPTVDVNTLAGTWRVPRHYIALHGLAAYDLPNLGFEQVNTRRGG